MNNTEGTIFIIDDDISVRRSLSLFLVASGYQVETFGSAEEYLYRDKFEGTGCLILDINMEGKSGLELQDELILQQSLLPIIFITGLGNIQITVTTLKKGAVNFLEKPFKDEDLLKSINEALLLSRNMKTEREEYLKAKSLIDLLTPRENEILKLLLTGILNKQIGGLLNIAEQTVKLHRASICEKLGVKSVQEIMRIADKARF
jgi:FixJ family two-component response regulator